MNEPTPEERSRLWLLCYAMTSTEKAIATCDLIASTCPDETHPLFEPLALAVHVYYARSFKANHGINGRLSIDLIPPDSRAIHLWLEHFRDGVMSHIDAKTSKTAGAPMNDVVFSVSEKSIGFSTLQARARLSNYSDAKKHCELMFLVYQNEMFELLKRFKKLLPSTTGDYLLSLVSGTPLFTSGYSRPASSLLSYKHPD